VDRPKPSKLLPRYVGPYIVLSQRNNDVEARHVVMGNIKTFFVEDLKLFRGTHEDATKLGVLDADQFEIDCFVAFRGDPETRQTVEFLVRFRDSEELWLPWSDDLFNTSQYEDYCRTTPGLLPLLYRLKELKVVKAQLRKSQITNVSPGDIVYVDLRSYGASWYSSLDLPDKDLNTFVLKYQYENFRKNQTSIVVRCDIFLENFNVDLYFINTWGSTFEFNSSRMVMIDDLFIQQCPMVLPADYESRLRSEGRKKG
jgi:hypothetical protein